LILPHILYSSYVAVDSIRKSFTKQFQTSGNYHSSWNSEWR